MAENNDSVPLTRDIAPFGLRMPPALKARVKLRAEELGRSLNAQIVNDLEYLYPPPSSIDEIQERLSKVAEGLVVATSEKERDKAVAELLDIKTKLRAAVNEAILFQIVPDAETD